MAMAEAEAVDMIAVVFAGELFDVEASDLPLCT